VVAVEALVAKVLADLVDALEAADDQALEVELVGDPEVEGLAEAVVERGEGPGRGAAVEGLERRGLDLEEVLAVQEATDGGDEAGAGLEDAADLAAGDEVDVALAVAQLDVLDAVPVGGRGVEGLGEDVDGGGPEGDLAGSGPEEGAGGLDDVAEVDEGDEAVEPLLARSLARR
jgi:hypothetical protein